MSEEPHRMKLSTVLKAMPTLMRGSPLKVLWGFTGGQVIEDVRHAIQVRHTLNEMTAQRAQRAAASAPKLTK
jgi:hypothetical protein